MTRKVIAAVLLVAMAVWAEMAMAPMLAMYSGHMLAPAASVPAQQIAHQHVRPASIAGHSCCPRLGVEPEAATIQTQTVPVCDDQHSCCFRQGPQSVPAPASDMRRLARGMVPTGTATLSPALSVANRAIDNNVLAFRSPPDAFGMTLRV
jgi:hypothetical protein